MKDSKVYIDHSVFMELVDELATQITEIKYGEDTYGFSNEVGQEDVIMFQEKAHDYYHAIYDEYEGLFNNVGNIYPNYNLILNKEL